MLTNRAAHAIIFLDHPQALIQDRLLNVMDEMTRRRARARMPAHFLRQVNNSSDRPGQVDSGGAGGDEIFAHLFEPHHEPVCIFIAKLLDPQVRTKSGRDPDGRRAAHDQPPDRVPHLLFIADLDIDRLRRQLRLIQKPHGRTRPFDRFEHALL